MLLFDEGLQANMFDMLFILWFYPILKQNSIMFHMLKIPLHKRKQPPLTVTKKVKVKVLAIHPVCQNGRLSCLFPAGIHREFKASGSSISDNLPFSLLLPFGHIILDCLISDGKDQRPLPPSYTFHQLWPPGRSAIYSRNKECP